MKLAMLFAVCLSLTGANGIHDADGKILAGLAPEELAMGTSGKLADREPTIEIWREKPVKTRGAPPYAPPATRQYNTTSGPVEGKINVHLCPHTHDDTGWQVTVDQYFFNEVYYVVDTVITELLKNPDRRFMYVEVGFFARWWEQQPEARRNLTRTLVHEGRLEFINGGWCMHDEASPLWVPMVDQTTRGHQWLVKNFGKTKVSRLQVQHLY
jgi:alpha-mannosidase